MDSLIEHMATAQAGSGRVLFVTGEPGIGKSSLLLRLLQAADESGWLVLMGRAYDTDAMPPYLPFAEALRDLPDQSWSGRLLAEAPEIASLIPGVGVGHSASTHTASLGPEADRYRLFEAVSRILEDLSRQPGRRGLLLAFEDIHWADRSTLLLLEHVARRLVSSPFLCIATHRDLDVGTMPDLSATLERLLRERLSDTLELDRLAPGDVSAMLEAMAGVSPPPHLSGAIYELSEGNPLFVEELFQFLVQEHTVFSLSNGWAREFSLGERVPPGVQLLIDRRVRQLSETCQQVLNVAAVLGRTFDHELLRLATSLDEDAFVDALEEAQRSRILRPAAETGGLAFTHELVRKGLLGGLSLPRKQRLHARVASAIEEVHRDNLGAFLADLTAHHRLANSPSSLRRAIGYAVQFGEQAMSVFAYREAADSYRQALQILNRVDPGDERQRCDLLLALGRASLPDGEVRVVIEDIAKQALVIGERLGDDARSRLACQLAMDALNRHGIRVTALTGEWLEWAKLTRRFAGHDTIDRIRLNVQWGERLHMCGREVEATELRLEALASARRSGSPDALIHAASFLLYYTQSPSRQEARLRLALEASEWSVEGATASTLAYFYHYLGWVCWDWGRRADAEAAWTRLRDLAGRTADNFATMFDFLGGFAAAIDGRLGDVLAMSNQTAPAGERLGSPVLGRFAAAMVAFRPSLLLGRTVGLLELLHSAWRDAGIDTEPANVKPRRLLVLANLGELAEARCLLHEIITERDIGPDDDGNVAMTDLLPLLEASVLLAEQEAAATLSARLQDVSHLVEAHGGASTSVARQLGRAAALAGDPATARRHYERALGVCRQIGFRPEAALVHLDIAQLLFEHFPGERGLALDQLNFAGSELEAMDMQPAMRRHRRLRSMAKQRIARS